MENRIGRAFGNPDYTSSHYAAYRGVSGFGQVVTPDEIRGHYLFGHRLVSVRGDVVTDANLQYYIDKAIEAVETDLNHIIVATQYRHRPVNPDTPRTDLPPWQAFRWDDLYEFNKNQFANFIQIKLHRKPIVKIDSFELFDPSTARVLINLLPWAKLKYEFGLLQAFPRAGQGLYTFPMTNPGGFVGQGVGLYPGGYDRYPNGYGVDFVAGYENARDIPLPLVDVCGMMASIMVACDYGDGIMPGISSANVSITGISENVSTGASGGNTVFGGRIREYMERIDRFWKENKRKFRGFQMGVL